MTNIGLWTINKDDVYAEEMADIVERAYDFFPFNLWDGVEVLGSIKIEPDTKVLIGGEPYPAHECIKLSRNLKKVKEMLDIKNPVIGVSYDPVVRIYNYIDTASGMFRHTVLMVRDYVYEDTVVCSVFGIPVNKSTDFAVHTLGHLGGLRHHEKPIDIMYYDLAINRDLRRDFSNFLHRYFCRRCKRGLKDYLEDGVK